MHYASTMLIRCADDRYSGGLELSKGLEEIILRENARVHFLPGGGFGSSLEFLLASSQKTWLERRQVIKSLGIQKVILIDHMGCAAFEQSFGQTMTAEQERSTHLEALEATRQFFEKEFPQLVFIAYLQDGDKIEKIF
jgi:hypothetical protein